MSSSSLSLARMSFIRLAMVAGFGAPGTIATRIKYFIDSESEFEDIGEIEPRLTVCVPSERARDAILRRIDGRYWWIMERLDFITLTCPEVAGLIV